MQKEESLEEKWKEQTRRMKEEEYVMKGHNVYRKRNRADTESNFSEDSIPIGKPVSQYPFGH